MDSVTCAFMKVIQAIYSDSQTRELMMNDQAKVLTRNGLEMIIQHAIPLEQDSEDAQLVHDMLIDWAIGSPRVKLFELSPTERSRTLVKSVLKTLGDDRWLYRAVLSLQATRGGRLDLALSKLE